MGKVDKRREVSMGCGKLPVRSKDYDQSFKSLIKEVESFVKYIFSKSPAPGHDWLHTNRVRNLALTIAETIPESNKCIVELSALFHDVGRIVSQSKHAEISAKIAEKFLLGRIDLDTVHKVVECVLEHSSIKEPKYIEGKILQDADKLDGMGAIGLLRLAESAAIEGKSEYDEAFPFGSGYDGNLKTWIERNMKEIPNTKMRLDYIIEEFIGKELQWINMLWTEKAKELAISRHNFMLKFLKEFEKELKESGIL